MPTRSVPRRLAWAIQTLAIAPDDRIMEIGCGGGLAAWLVCQQLTRGRIVAIDRSATMARTARLRNIDNVESGKATFLATALDAADFGGQRFDKVFAVNVNLFWVPSSLTELDVVLRALNTGGGLYLFYERPQADRAWGNAEHAAAFLGDHGFSTTTVSTTTAPPDSARARTVVCVQAHPQRT